MPNEQSGGGYERANRREQAAGDELALSWPFDANVPNVQFQDTFWGNRHHAGLDIPAPRGTSVWATTSGRVVRSRRGEEEGNYVAVRDDAGRLHYYLHLQRPSPLLDGDPVQAGRTFVGLVGDSGRADGPHLHYAIVLPNRHVINPFRALERARGEDSHRMSGYVGDGATDARVATYDAAIRRLATEVSHWAYPPELEARITSEARGTYRNLRETSRDSVLRGLRATRALVSAGRWDEARSMLERSDERWALWLAQVARMVREDITLEQSHELVRSYTDAFDDFAHDVAQLPGAIVDAVQPALGLGALVALGLGLFAISRAVR